MKIEVRPNLRQRNGFSFTLQGYLETDGVTQVHNTDGETRSLTFLYCNVDQRAYFKKTGPREIRGVNNPLIIFSLE